ncbi:L,D-transpeptidase [Wielerella bovis]|uniref:L,D-transpeptidase n=1 Tax=Wielerella bovis TaxID=2917790 RepID=UPI002019A1D6|nr:L,D-transpeptidase [Wielerella bovis]MCG7658074.1 L,D-transpeptidase [Wielerella bovis]MCG7660296.1 L,D-transpeptidase [Wielerella bovis]ULJ69224.1 L,D-transpeptidase [Wielerella bovis]
MKSILFGAFTFALASTAFAAQTTPVPDVAPVADGQHVVINIPQQRLFLYENGSLKKVYPVGVGKATTQTNLGDHKIGAKAFNPTWHIPLSIQKERGDGVKTVPPGPKNPLGPVFVRLGNPKLGLGIHGTSNPASVPGIVSHGCVRMKSPDALEFARRISTGADATVSYELAALNQDDAGHLWLAAFRDPYSKKNLRVNVLKQSIAAWAKANNRTIRTAQIDQIVKARAAKPVCLTCTNKNTRPKGDFVSIAWNSGGADLTQPKGATASIRPPVKDEILPEGTEIEVEALDDFKGASVFDDEEGVVEEATNSIASGEIPLKPL